MALIAEIGTWMDPELACSESCLPAGCGDWPHHAPLPVMTSMNDWLARDGPYHVTPTAATSAVTQASAHAIPTRRERAASTASWCSLASQPPRLVAAVVSGNP